METPRSIAIATNRYNKNPRKLYGYIYALARDMQNCKDSTRRRFLGHILYEAIIIHPTICENALWCLMVRDGDERVKDMDKYLTRGNFLMWAFDLRPLQVQGPRQPTYWETAPQ